MLLLAIYSTVLVMTVAQLSPSGDIRVCLDAVIEMTCNISRSRSMLNWEVTPPMSQFAAGTFMDTNNLPSIGMPVPHGLPGINVTILNVTSTSIVSNLTVDTSNYDLTGEPLTVRCTGAEGEAEIRNLG